MREVIIDVYDDILRIAEDVIDNVVNIDTVIDNIFSYSKNIIITDVLFNQWKRKALQTSGLIQDKAKFHN